MITCNSSDIMYTLRISTRARNMRISIHPEGSCVVTVPHGISETTADRFVERHAAWIQNKLDVVKKSEGKIGPKGTRKEYMQHKESARERAAERMAYFNTFYNFSWNKISIRNQKSRWGSCSKKGNINFNFKIAFLPEHLADYIIVHELCHLGEFNHSQKFWDLVARTIPNHKALRHELKTLRR